MDGYEGPDVVPAAIYGAEGSGATDCGARESGGARDVTATHSGCLPTRSGGPLNVRAPEET